MSEMKKMKKMLAKFKDLSGCNKRVFDPCWHAIDGTIEQVRGTGESRYDHKMLPRPVLVGRKKCIPRDLTILLRRQLKAMEGGKFSDPRSEGDGPKRNK